MFEDILNLNANFTSIVRKISKKHSITLQQALILSHISISGSPMSILANRLGLDPSTITRNIEKLELKNLLYRERSTSDTRMIYVYKSAEGGRIAREIEKEVEIILKHSSQRTAELRDAIQTMNWNLEKETA